MTKGTTVPRRTDRFRIIVWGPGGLGSFCIREIAMSQAFELVGVRAYSEAKHGIDAGTLTGIDPVGVKASSNVRDLLALACDCVLYTARDYGQYTTDDEIIQLLEAGKNVITVLPYQHLEIARSVDFVARVNRACAAGGSVFHATGVNPDLIPDRVLLALTGLCNDIRSVKLQEYWDCSNVHPETLKVCGYGAPLEVVEKSPMVAAIVDNFLKMGLMSWAKAMGVIYDRVEIEPEFGIVDADIDLGSGFVVGKGTVGRITRRWCGYVDERGRDPFMTVEVNWVMSKQLLSPEFSVAAGFQGWLMSIEGRPSLRTVIDIKASLGSSERFLVPGNPATDAGYNAVVATILQAVPHVCAAAPGILQAPHATVHWMPDLRRVSRG